MTAFDPTIQVIINGGLFGDEIDITTLNITGGRTSNGYQPEPMQAIIDLIPSSGNITYSLMDEVEIQVIDPSTSNPVTIFWGFIQDINFGFAFMGNAVGQRKYTIVALDPTSTLPFATFNASPTIAQANAGRQIGQALSYWDYASMIGVRWSTYPTLSPTIDSNGGATFALDQINVTTTDNVGEFIAETASQVNGCFYFKPQDKQIWFDGVDRRKNRTAFTLGYNEIKPDITLTQSVGMIMNKVLVTRAGTDASNSNSTSINEFGERSFTRDTRLHDLADATTKAANYLSAFSGVSSGSLVKRWRPTTISVDLHNPDITDSKRSSLLNIFCGTPVTVTVPDPTDGISDLVLSCYIEGWQWTFGPKQMSLTASLALKTDLPE